jgi:cation transport regulator ChaC
VTDTDVWLFAYGSNLDRAQKEDRTGTIREHRVCKLPGFSLAFNKRSIRHGAAANVVPDADSEVWGVAFLCGPKAIKEMNEWEKGYCQRRVLVEERSGQNLDAIAYVAEPSSLCTNCSPSAAYLSMIIGGATYWGLPPKYIASIRARAVSSQSD